MGLGFTVRPYCILFDGAMLPLNSVLGLNFVEFLTRVTYNWLFFALTDTIQTEFAVFESIAGLRNWLHHIFIRGMRVPDVEHKIGVQV
jgi:hypothetical protein